VDGFPLGAAVTLGQLEGDPHPVLRELRQREPVSWLPALDGWLVTRYDLAVEVMRDAVTFTVDDPRFSTAQVIGPSMLSLDGPEHERHRTPFVAPFRPEPVRDGFAAVAASEASRLIDRFAAAGRVDLLRSFAGPLAASIVTRALGLDQPDEVRGWYGAIVGAVTSITAGDGVTAEGREAFDALSARVRSVIDGAQTTSLLAAAAHGSALSAEQVVSNAAVLLFGGIETTEGMIANAVLYLLAEQPEALERGAADPRMLDAAIDESLRLEPAAAVVDRYCTRDAELGGATVTRGDLVRVSIAAANRDPAVFEHPDSYDLGRRNARRHLAFAQGPHVCVGVHLARLEARAALDALLGRLNRLRLDPERPSAARGLVFRKPPALHVVWDP
jgi:cytochrome P450